MPKPMREMQVLLDYTIPAADLPLAAGTFARPIASTYGGELAADECAEVVMADIIPPVNGGVAEDLRYIGLILDGTREQRHYLPGSATYLTHAPKWALLHGYRIYFGKPVWNLKGKSPEDKFLDMMSATCPKYKRSVSIECYAQGAVNVQFRVILYGYRYRAQDLAYVTSVIGGADYLIDPSTGRKSQYVAKSPILPTWQNWTQLPGGMEQGTPKVFGFMRLALNRIASTVNTPFSMRYESVQNVLNPWEELFFNYDVEDKIAVIRGLGVRNLTNIDEIWVDVNGEERPFSRWPISSGYNPFIFGQVQPLLPAGMPLYATIPMLPDPILIAGEKANIYFEDNGVACGAGSVAIIVNGQLVELS